MVIISVPEYIISYHTWDKNSARAILFWRTGALKFRTTWRIYNQKKGIGIGCVMPMCPGTDDLNHVKVCKFYDTKWDDKFQLEKDLASYLVKISRERFIKVKLPLF